MTSSLVGSEMCIRDRIKGKEEAITNHVGDISVLRQREEELLQQTRDAAVSYTHLTLPTICSV
eukprot:584726-Prorocentrum_lima.AAC.1